MNPLAKELNLTITDANAQVMAMLSQVGRQLFFPKGILSQSAEAKEKAHRINGTIGIAKQDGDTMCFDTIMGSLHGIGAAEALTYAPSFGIPALRERWRQELYAKNPSLKGKAVSLPVVTCGITHAISVFADVWIDPGDVILVPDMMWGNYNMIFNVRKDARLNQYTLFDDQGRYNLEALSTAVADGVRTHQKIVVLFNFPQNPTGYTLTGDEADAVVDILTQAAENGCRVLAVMDDAYFGLFYDEQALQESLFAKLCGRHPNLLAVKLDGATKEYFVWGLRIGFITYGMHTTGDPGPAYDALERKTAGCVRGSISNASHLGQTMVLKALNSARLEAEKQEKFDILKARALKVKAVLADDKYKDAWQAYPFNSGYFMCLKLKTVEAEPLRVHLLDRYGVGLIASGKHDLRVAFSCVDEALIQELFDTVLQGIKDLQTG
ncbi:MAG: aminotransferase class I/II-fold pyridoxal phosphate-dependent enzyme [Desulfatitalea sp.]|nr:aminotransferase class I/II-fold pyridoxal phosphate-dependent enzyme [Desulfatitalea sp.]NNJ99290.1 aminotransferase class I/II-fold pyridoxal phosphate-dependent enzyme [Desulfatitalea sp.]